MTLLPSRRVAKTRLLSGNVVKMLLPSRSLAKTRSQDATAIAGLSQGAATLEMFS